MIQLRCASPFQTGTSRTSFRVSHNIAAVHLHKVWLDEKAGLSAAASSNHKDIFVSCILWLLRSAAHHQPFRLGQQYVVCKYRVNVGLYILGVAPTGRAIFHALTVFFCVLAFGVDNQPDKDSSDTTYQHIHRGKTRQGRRKSRSKAVPDA